MGLYKRLGVNLHKNSLTLPHSLPARHRCLNLIIKETYDGVFNSAIFQDCSTIIITTLKISIKMNTMHKEGTHPFIHLSIYPDLRDWHPASGRFWWRPPQPLPNSCQNLPCFPSLPHRSRLARLPPLASSQGPWYMPLLTSPSNPFWIAPTQPSIRTCIPVCYAKPLSSFKFASSHHQLYLPAKASRKSRWYLWQM